MDNFAHNDESLIREALRLARVGSWEFDLSAGRYVWSEELYRILGYEPGRTAPGFEAFAARVHPDDLQQLVVAYNTFADSVPLLELELRIALPEKGVRHVLCCFKGDFDSQGGLVRMFATVQDITARKIVEEELRHSRDEMEINIRERTAALKIANRRLQSELAERNRTEHLLRQSESQLRSILDNTQDAYLRADMSGRVIMVNPSALRMWGYDSAEEMTGLPVVELYTPGPDQQTVMDELAVTGILHNRKIQSRKKDGAVFWVSVNLQYYRDEQGRVQGTEAFARDITENIVTENALRRRKAEVKKLLEESEKGRMALLSILEDVRQKEQDIKEREELFRTIFHAANDAIIIIDATGTIKLFNSTAEALYGYAGDEALGMSYSELIPVDIRGVHQQWMHRVAEKGQGMPETKFQQGRALRRDGSEFTAETTISHIQTPEGAIFIIVLRDITERKLLEQETMRSSQLASIGELAAGVAHEINNPIMGVINYAQILHNKFENEGGDADILARIIREGNRVAKIVKNLLSFAREDNDKPEAVPPQTIVEDALALVHKVFLQNGVVLRVALPEDLPSILVRPQKIQQVYINILTNALYALNEKFPGGDDEKILEISGEVIAAPRRAKTDQSGLMRQDATQPLPDAPPAINDAHAPAAAFVRITFHDRGCGIRQDSIEKICNPFYTTKPAGRGTGLGLSISHNIVNEYGGKLLFESAPGEYTRVMVDLPAAQ